MKLPPVSICRTGVTRIVILIGRWAIKLPRFGHGWRLGLRGLLCNMQERQFAATGWPELCPVVWAAPGGFLLIMRRARELTREEWFAFNPKTFHDYYENGELVRSIPVEEKMDSFGMLDGRIVAIDYGS